MEEHEQEEVEVRRHPLPVVTPCVSPISIQYNNTSKQIHKNSIKDKSGIPIVKLDYL